MRPGSALDYLASVRDERAPIMAEFGHTLTGLYEVLMCDHEVVVTWATDPDSHVALQRGAGRPGRTAADVGVGVPGLHGGAGRAIGAPARHPGRPPESARRRPVRSLRGRGTRKKRRLPIAACVAREHRRARRLPMRGLRGRGTQKELRE